MNTRLTPLIFLGLGLHCTFAAEAQTAPGPVASEVVGFAAFEVPGASQAGTPQLSMKGIGLIRSIEYQGTAEAIRGRTLTDKQAVWTNNQFNPPKATLATATHYLEITSGPMAGALFDIVQTDAARHTLTVAQILPAKIGRSAGFRVRMHWTLASLFGAANQAGLQPGDEATADLVSIYNGKRYDNYYYSNGVAGDGWRRVGGGNVDLSGRQIYPDDGLAITRRAATPVSPLIAGVVKTDRTSIPVQKGFNLIANVYQTPMTLNESQLYTRSLATGVRWGATAATADNVSIYNGTGYETYYYQISVRNGSGWRLANDVHTDVGRTPIPIGSAFVIQRRGSVGFNWMAPKP